MLIYFVIAYLVLGLIFGGLSFFAIMSWSHNAGWQSVTLKDLPWMIGTFILFVLAWPYVLWKSRG